MKHLFTLSAVATLLAGIVAPASAHCIYVAQRHSELGVVLGYSSVDQKYSPDSISVVSAYAADGKPEPVEKISNGTYVTLAAPDVAVIGVAMDGGLYATPDASGSKGWKKGGKTSVPGAVKGLHAIKYNLSIQKDSDVAIKPRGVGLEIVPLEMPMKKVRGDMLSVQVLLDGRPLEGVQLREDFVNNDSLLTKKTDAAGKTLVTLHDDMLNVIGLEYDAPVAANPDIDFNRYATSLSFALPHKEQ
ncbi:DUF4198 domain-containing protein [Paraburkholderia sp.]|uniref:DUF4198 domain-containing protein n=1 Tax=Paraburkholderia sp. TaxID=1926495 RepID=UPI0039E24186